MTDEERIAAANERYMAAMHAVQSGIAMKLNIEGGPQERPLGLFSPKHTRVGITSMQVDAHAVATLLIEKGIITQAEYHEQIAKSAEEERDRWEAELSEYYGRKVTLI